MRFDIRNAQTILVPKGVRYDAMAEAASEEFDIDFPTFPKNKDVIQFDGREFRRAQDDYIPELISRGVANVGFAGLDSCVEANASVSYRSFGQPFAFFELLAPEALADQAVGRLTTGNKPLEVRTSYPRLLGSGAMRKGVALMPANETSALQLLADVVPADSKTLEGLKKVLRLREIRPSVVLPRTA